MIAEKLPESPWTPLGDRIICVDVTIHGTIVLPDGARPRPEDVRLEIVEIGDEVKKLKIGDHVMLSKDTPVASLEHSGMKFYVTCEEFVTAVWKDSRA
jgi:hypothetical protein